MKIKDLIKKTFLYKLYATKRAEKANRVYNKMHEAFKKEGLQTYLTLANALNQEGIVFWLEYGTLLGYYREHDFIPHDVDLDVSANLEDAEKVKDALEHAGFELIRTYRTNDGDGLEHCYRLEGYTVTIDVFYHQHDDKHTWCYGFRPANGINPHIANTDLKFACKRVVFPYAGLMKTEFKGVQVYVPTNTAEHLASHYGEDFMIPNPKFSNSMTLNVEWYEYEQKPSVAYFNVPW